MKKILLTLSFITASTAAWAQYRRPYPDISVVKEYIQYYQEMFSLAYDAVCEIVDITLGSYEEYPDPDIDEAKTADKRKKRNPQNLPPTASADPQKVQELRDLKAQCRVLDDQMQETEAWVQEADEYFATLIEKCLHSRNPSETLIKRAREAAENMPDDYPYKQRMLNYGK